MSLTARENIIEVVNKLFIYTDDRQWEKLQAEVFTPIVFLDMSSLGAEAATLSSAEICANWEKGFEGIDAINHLAGNHLVTINGKEADVYVYATATHFKAAATHGKTREFVGSYDLHLINTEMGWRINKFKYNLKYTNGNMELE